jgi:hypothetical protein
VEGGGEFKEDAVADGGGEVLGGVREFREVVFVSDVLSDKLGAQLGIVAAEDVLEQDGPVFLEDPEGNLDVVDLLDEVLLGRIGL